MIELTHRATGLSIASSIALVFLCAGVSQAQLGAIGPNQEIAWEQGPSEAPNGDRPPNIVLILADDLGWNDITLNGGIADGTVPTPHIDSLARDGCNFINGYSACGTCAPSRAALMSGRYPTRFGFEFTPMPPQMPRIIAGMAEAAGADPPLITHFDLGGQLPYQDMGMPSDEVSLAETLGAAGYHNVHIGKWHLGLTNGMAPHDQGFDESLLMASGLYLPEDDPNVINSKQDFDPIDRFLWMSMQHAASFNGSAPFQPNGYLTDYYTDEAVKVIEANKNRPFFLYLAHWAPHTPLQATKEDYDALAHIDDHIERTYAAMIRALDRGIGRVLAALEENGLEENTLVIFTSDNGGAGYIGLGDINKPYRGWKITFFEGGIHVPYLMRWPTRIKPGTIVDDPVHHFDVYATVAAAVGAALPTDRSMDGANLLPFAAKTAPADSRPHNELFWRDGHYQVVITDGWKLQRADRPDKVWLFNLMEDPTEQNNIAEDHPDKVASLHALLDAHNAEQVEPLWPALLESPQFIDKTGREPRDPETDEYVYWSN